MKSFRHIAVAALLTVGSFSAVTYTSCSKDDKCANISCGTGTCDNGTCQCPTGYSGANCTLDFIGTWNGSDACTGGHNYTNITVAINSSTSTTASLLVSNIGGFGSNATISANLNATLDTLSFVNQAVSTDVVVSGYIALTSNTTFSIVYNTADNSGNQASCTGSYIKQ